MQNQIAAVVDNSTRINIFCSNYISYSANDEPTRLYYIGKLSPVNFGSND